MKLSGGKPDRGVAHSVTSGGDDVIIVNWEEQWTSRGQVKHEQIIGRTNKKADPPLNPGMWSWVKPQESKSKDVPVRGEAGGLTANSKKQNKTESIKYYVFAYYSFINCF